MKQLQATVFTNLHNVTIFFFFSKRKEYAGMHKNTAEQLEKACQYLLLCETEWLD